MIDLRHALTVLAARMSWASIEATLALIVARRAREGWVDEGIDLFCALAVLAGTASISSGRGAIRAICMARA